MFQHRNDHNTQQQHCCKYFAIGAMMNPTSLKLRDVTPVASEPAELLNFDIQFFGSMGYAEAIPSRGKSFHGVIHTLTNGDMKKLDDMEGHLYSRKQAVAQTYGGEKVSVTVYCRKDDGDHEDRQRGIPQERYIDIMVEGARHFGVKQDYIKWLQGLEQEPRPQPSEFSSFGDPNNLDNAKTTKFTEEEILQQDGEEGRPFWVTLNAKLLEILNPTQERTGLLRKMRQRFHTAAVEEILPKVVYDPKYGVPKDRHDCTREHAAYLEHLATRRLGVDGARVMGLIKQNYRD